jgi:4-amino-4-deoxy-L-arabinose transferase-like glycosyltransferase
LLALVALGFAVRAGWCAIAARRPDVFGDPFTYLHHADDIAAGRGYVTYFYAAPTAYFPVGYPALVGGLLWAMRLVAGAATAMQAAIVLNLVAGTATVWLTYLITLRLADRRAARVAAALVAVFPGLVFFSATAYVETVFTALVMLFAWMISRRDELVPGAARLVALGLVFGGLALVRPVVLPFAVVLAFVWRHAGWRASLRATATIVLIAAIVITPWSIRSSKALHGFVLVATNTGDDLCTGHSSFSTGEYVDLGTHCWLGYDGVSADHLEVERDRAGTRGAIGYAAHHPTREATLLVEKAWHLVAHDHEGVLAVDSYGDQPVLPDAVRVGAKLVADVWWWALVLLAIAGLRALWRAGPPGRILLGFAAVVLGVPLVLFGGARFHVPVAPIMAIAAALTLTSPAVAHHARASRSR